MQKPIVNEVIEEAAQAQKAVLGWVTKDLARDLVENLAVLNPALAGSHQYANLSLAIEASREFLARRSILF